MEIAEGLRRSRNRMPATKIREEPRAVPPSETKKVCSCETIDGRMDDPHNRTIAVYRSSEEVWVVKDRETIDGGVVLPQWSFNTEALFAELDRKAPPTE